MKWSKIIQNWLPREDQKKRIKDFELRTQNKYKVIAEHSNFSEYCILDSKVIILERKITAWFNKKNTELKYIKRFPKSQQTEWAFNPLQLLIDTLLKVCLICKFPHSLIPCQIKSYLTQTTLCIWWSVQQLTKAYAIISWKS